MTVYEGQLDGDGLRVAIAASRFNDAHHRPPRRRGHRRPAPPRRGRRGRSTWPGRPGAFELPLVAPRLAASGEYDAVITLGAVIRGATGHYDLVAGQCAAGVQRAQLDTGRARSSSGC